MCHLLSRCVQQPAIPSPHPTVRIRVRQFESASGSSSPHFIHTPSQIHGRVCACIKETYCEYKRLDDLNCCDDREKFMALFKANTSSSREYNYSGNI